MAGILRWVAFLPLVRLPGAGETSGERPVRTGGQRPNTSKGLTAAMELFVLLAFFVLLATASALGWTADSRDSADWRPGGL